MHKTGKKDDPEDGVTRRHELRSEENSISVTEILRRVIFKTLWSEGRPVRAHTKTRSRHEESYGESRSLSMRGNIAKNGVQVLQYIMVQ